MTDREKEAADLLALENRHRDDRNDYLRHADPRISTLESQLAEYADSLIKQSKVLGEHVDRVTELESQLRAKEKELLDCEATAGRMREAKKRWLLLGQCAIAERRHGEMYLLASEVFESLADQEKQHG